MPNLVVSEPRGLRVGAHITVPATRWFRYLAFVIDRCTDNPACSAARWRRKAFLECNPHRKIPRATPKPIMELWAHPLGSLGPRTADGTQGLDALDLYELLLIYPPIAFLAFDDALMPCPESSLSKFCAAVSNAIASRGAIVCPAKEWVTLSLLFPGYLISKIR